MGERGSVKPRRSQKLSVVRSHGSDYYEQSELYILNTQMCDIVRQVADHGRMLVLTACGSTSRIEAIY